MPTYLAVRGESFLCSLTSLQDLGSSHLTFDCLVLHRAPSRHVILSQDIEDYLNCPHEIHTKNMTKCGSSVIKCYHRIYLYNLPSFELNLK